MISSWLSSMCEDTKLKAIHNLCKDKYIVLQLSSMCEDTKLKAIHNITIALEQSIHVVFNVRRY